MKKEYLQIPNDVSEKFKEPTELQKFCRDVLMPKLSDKKREAVFAHMEKGVSIDGAMALEKIKITICER